MSVNPAASESEVASSQAPTGAVRRVRRWTLNAVLSVAGVGLAFLCIDSLAGYIGYWDLAIVITLALTTAVVWGVSERRASP